MKILSEYYSVAEAARFNNTARGRSNLDNALNALYDAGAISAVAAISNNKLSRLTGIDPSQLSRLLTDRPGFVKVFRHPYGKSLVKALGYYLDNAVLVEVYNPSSTVKMEYPSPTKLREIAATGRLAKSVTLVEERGDTPTTTKVVYKDEPDEWLLKLQAAHGKPYSGQNITVPVDSQSSEITVGMILGGIRNLAEQADKLSLFRVCDLPDTDLATFEEIIGRLALITVDMLSMTRNVKDARILR